MFYVNRSWFKYGNETDEVVVTIKAYETFEKALAYGERYAKGIRFCSFEIEDEDGTILYEQFADGTVEDHRKEVEQKQSTEDNNTFECNADSEEETKDLFNKLESLILDNKNARCELNGKQLEDVYYLKLEFNNGRWRLQFKQTDGNEFIEKEYKWNGT